MSVADVQLSAETTARLDELIERWNPLGELRARNGCIVALDDSECTGTRRRRRIRLPPPGCMIRRTYEGREISVRVMERGFEYDGEHYRSLSAIAKAVTGAKWNGNLFFGCALCKPRGHNATKRKTPRGELMDDRHSKGGATK